VVDFEEHMVILPSENGLLVIAKCSNFKIIFTLLSFKYAFFSKPEKVQDFLSGTQNLRFETLS